MNNTKQSIQYIQKRIQWKPEIAIILGSGLGNFAESIEEKIEIPYEEIPGFPQSTVKGHDGRLIFGRVADKKVVAMKGRIHYYEGLGINRVVYPIEVLCDLGIQNLIVTNACGGVNKNFKPGDLMIIKDHINFTGENPLIGPNDDAKGPRFLDLTYTYDPKLQQLAKKVSHELNIQMQEGVYMWFTGPCYETPAEVRMAGILGADAVGMSTVPEVLLAHHRGIKVLGISCITNMAAGILDQPLDHEEVIEVSSQIEDRFKSLVAKIIEEM
ncbi:MAG: purine-nucleoside phosphorylase [Tissierellia bacterium]|nr:purine-nucleoside phosphorylase [Tissierellia bacterium]